jgi:hypothetical protein
MGVILALSVAATAVDAFVVPSSSKSTAVSHSTRPSSPTFVQRILMSKRRKRSLILSAEKVVILRMDGEEPEEEDEEDDDEEEEDDPYLEVATTEFVDTVNATKSSGSLIRSSSAISKEVKEEPTTTIDWGGALGQLRKRVDDVETGKSQDPSHALFRVMSSQTPNQQIGQFIASTKPAVIQAMTGAVSSLLGGLWQPMNGADVIIKASGDKISSLCFQLQMTGYMFRNAEYVMALKQLMDIQPTATLQDYRDAFDDLDLDGSGYIDASEVRELLNEVYDGKTPAFEVASFIQFFDTDKDGRVSWEEFERGLGSALAKANEASARVRVLTGHGDDDDDDDDESLDAEPTITGTLEIELDDGKVIEVEAAEYVKSLKQEARALKAALRRETGLSAETNAPRAMGNSASLSVEEFGGIASYIASRQGDIKSLTEGISPEIVETMKKLINFVLEGGDSGKVPKDVKKEELELELPGAALHQLALWQLVLGYRLREAEAKGDYLKLVE